MSTGSDDPSEAADARSYWILTQAGAMFARFRTISHAARKVLNTEGGMAVAGRGMNMNHEYEIAERIDAGHAIILHVRFVGL